MIRRLISALAYRRWQSRVRKAREAARRSHRATAPINASQQKTLHAALRAGVQKQGS